MDIKPANQVNLMIVDDDPENIRALGRCLPKGYQYKSALNGLDALNQLWDSEEVPDLILLDMLMPGMDGVEVCRRIKADDRLSAIPVIFLSGAFEVSTKIKALSFGGVDYITKPFNFDEVLARIDLHLQLAMLRNELKTSNNHLEVLIREKIRELSALQMETIFALVCLVGRRDEYTNAHMTRLQNVCRLMALRLQESARYKAPISATFIEQLFNTCPLYDIGKISIPDAILLKTGELTPAEYQVMTNHTRIGADTLREVQDKHPDNEFIAMGIDIALSHHEKWDGSGYPNGLIGTDIPLAAQIVGIIETFDALLSKRPYKEAVTFDEAYLTITECSGTCFNPDMVKAFVDMTEDLKTIYSDTL